MAPNFSGTDQEQEHRQDPDETIAPIYTSGVFDPPKKQNFSEMRF